MLHKRSNYFEIFLSRVYLKTNKSSFFLSFFVEASHIKPVRYNAKIDMNIYFIFLFL